MCAIAAMLERFRREYRFCDSTEYIFMGSRRSSPSACMSSLGLGSQTTPLFWRNLSGTSDGVAATCKVQWQNATRGDFFVLKRRGIPIAYGRHSMKANFSTDQEQRCETERKPVLPRWAMGRARGALEEANVGARLSF